jgi:hypothetical protein
MVPTRQGEPEPAAPWHPEQDGVLSRHKAFDMMSHLPRRQKTIAVERHRKVRYNACNDVLLQSLGYDG